MDFSMLIEKKYLNAASTQPHLLSIDKACREAPPGDFMECGVLRGGTAAILINAAGPGRKIYLCDTFEGYPLPGEHDTNINKGPFVPGFLKYGVEKVSRTLRGFGLDLRNVVFVKGEFRDTMEETMKGIEGLALVNFDGDWYESVMDAFPHILRKLVPGGMLIIHDYPKYKGTVKGVHEFIDMAQLHTFKEETAREAVYYIKPEDGDVVRE